MKVIVQIPCFNEEATLPLVMADMPKQIPGVDTLEYLVVDDGCTDNTVAVAEKLGVHHIVTHAANMGLARSFRDGTDRALELGADIVVNTDGDNQYPQARIPDLIQPILKGQAHIVIADRETHKIAHFSRLKKFLQKAGSFVVSKAAGTDIPDAVSGFRAYSREALLQINPITRFSYTVETIIQAGNKGLSIMSIPIATNPKTRESRLFKSYYQLVFKQMVTIMRAYTMYRPYVIFGWIGWVLFITGLFPFARFILHSLADGTTRGHIQSLLIGSVLMIGAFLCLVLNIIADLIRINRTLIENNLEQTRRIRFSKD